MRIRYDRTSGMALNCVGSNQHATLAADASFGDLPFSTAYMVVNVSGVAPAFFAYKASNFAPPNFANRDIGLAAGGSDSFLQARVGRSSTLSTMVDAEIFPRDVWMQIAVSWAVSDMRMFKAVWPRPLREVSYSTYTFGSGAGFDPEGNQPWTIGENTPTGSPANGAIQHFRVYNEFHDRDEVRRHQYEFGPARGQVINMDMGLRVGTNVLDIVRGALAPIVGAGDVAGTFLMEPDFMPEFIGSGGGAGAAIAAKVAHQRFHNLAL